MSRENECTLGEGRKEETAVTKWFFISLTCKVLSLGVWEDAFKNNGTFSRNYCSKNKIMFVGTSLWHWDSD